KKCLAEMEVAILQVQKKSKAFALPIEYAFDPFSILLAAARKPRLDPSSKTSPRETNGFIPLLLLWLKK
ncbi:hypothetical protein VXQ18_00015, partial [Brucella abortus]|nr:hypothetical protein [Brucella abortus]